MEAIQTSQYYKDFFEEFEFEQMSSNKHVAIDLVNVMAAVYYNDISTNKIPPRAINLDVPVYLVEKWIECKPLLQKLLKWVSEDDFYVSFYENTEPESTVSAYIDTVGNKDTVTLFSGGLDSFAGAFHNISYGVKSDYLGFINKGEERTKQKVIREFYNKVFVNSSVHLIEKHPIKKTYYTQSTRSLLYLSLAVARGLTDKRYNQVQIFENGVLSLNPELRGRYTTKTTHPYTIYLFNQLLQHLDIDIVIHNPFIFKTKGQIFQGFSDDFKQQIAGTFTCGQSRVSPTRNHKGQCGVCVPCLLRKISLAANELEGYDSDYYYPYEIKLADIQEDDYRKDYASNFEYFSEYVELIKSRSILSHVQIRTEYYMDSLALDRTINMLDIFAAEFERFKVRYAPD
jgi:7-cyano-7-deazaguanine synthase in queuosine biosynthesis